MVQTIVLGAGMVGVSTALAVQARGHQVLLLDRRGIGRETSYGNAGAIQTEAVEPYAFPRNVQTLVKIALKRTNDVNWHLSSLSEYVAPLFSYWIRSAAASHRQISAIYKELVDRADQFHAPLIAASGSEGLIDKNGYRSIFRTSTRFEREVREARRMAETYGIHCHIETGDELAAAETGLKFRLAGAVHYHNVWTCRSPGELTAAYGRLFQSRGGIFAYGDAQSLSRDGAGWGVLTERGKYTAENAIVALGSWSTRISERFGYRIPMFRKRGYHRHFEVANGPASSMMDVERGTFIARMDQGMRLTTGAELTRQGAPIDWRQIRRSEKAARELFSIGNPIEAEPWFGDRPCMPDMLPVMGEAPDHPGLWFHFGHGHQGFTMGPASSELLANLMTGHETPLTQALSPRRFV